MINRLMGSPPDFPYVHNKISERWNNSGVLVESRLMPVITLPDGKTLSLNKGDCVAQIAAAISPSFAKRALACRLDGQLADLTAAVSADAPLRFITREDDEALALIRHDCAHVLAQAVQHLYPEAQPTIGPVIEDGFYYDFYRETPFTPEDLVKIEKRMQQLVQQKIPFQREVWTRDEALAYYEQRNEPFKCELINAIGGDEDISFYRQGDFIDLCRGPHMRHTGDVGAAFKLMRLAGSYWRGDAQGTPLQRIYGTAWRDAAELQAYLHRLQEAQRRDHRRLGQAMDLFHLQDEAAGMTFWHDKGWTLYRLLEAYIRRRQQAAGYLEVKTPQLVSRKLWEKSGHWDKFRQNMYIAESEDGLRDYIAAPQTAPVFALKPMNCPGHVQIYKQGVKSYRDLPLRMSEFGSCHRCEPSGALHGIMRVRNFVQDDAHIFCSEEQIAAETVKFVQLLGSIYRDLGFEEFSVKFSDRPPQRAGSDEVWDKAEQALRDACSQAGVEWTLNPGDGAFYGPKLEFILKDAIGREWQCGTWQVDFVLPERLDADYTAMDGSRRRPVMCHRTVIGSFERFIGILIEHFAGHLPLWLAPLQVVAATITSDADAYAQEVVAALTDAGLRAEADCRNEKINYKVRMHSEAKVPVILALGKRESEQQTVSMRRLGSRDSKTLPLPEAISQLTAESRPPA